jgi:hypothetical protein
MTPAKLLSRLRDEASVERAVISGKGGVTGYI